MRTEGFVSLITALKDLVAAIWEKGNQKLRFLMIAFFMYVTCWFATVFFFAAVNSKLPIIIFTFFALFVVGVIFIAEPILGLVFLNINQTKALRKGLGLILLSQMLIGIYLTVVPVHVYPANFLLLVIFVVAILLLSFSVENKRHKGYKWGMRALVIGTLIITFIFLDKGGVITEVKESLNSPKTAIGETIQKTFGPSAEVTITKKDGNVFLIHMNERQNFTIISTGTFRFYDPDTEEYSDPIYPGKQKLTVTAGGKFYVSVEQGEANIKVYVD